MKEQSKKRHGAAVLLVSSLAVMSVAAAASTAPDGSGRGAGAPIGQYLMASQEQEIALARSAAPASISGHASVMVLAKRGYITAVKGTNGFVCLVTRPWDNDVDVSSAIFWDTKFHAPFCLNPAAVQSVLPLYLMRTQWVVGGASQKQIGEREKAAWAAGKLEAPKRGAICYMMSKHGNLGKGSPWRPHVMFYAPPDETSTWGVNLPGAPMMSAPGDHTNLVFVLVPVWSDGTPAPKFD